MCCSIQLHRRLCTLLALAAGLLGGTLAQAEPFKIAFIPKGNTHLFWREMARGASDAAMELGVRMQWRGPANEDGVEAQAGIMAIYIQSRFDGLILAPNASDALQQSVALARANGLKLLIVDSALTNQAGLPFVGTNNRKAGEMAARQALRDAPRASRVLVLRYAPQHSSTTEREEGFIHTLRQALPKALIDDRHYSGMTVGEAETALTALLQESQGFDILFTPNESGTVAAANVLQSGKLAGRVGNAYGFDYTARIHDALQGGVLKAVVVQDPYLMGRKSMTLMHDMLSGRAAPPVFETPAAVVTRANMGAPEIRAKVAPFLALPSR